jgi:hypothetical protein
VKGALPDKEDGNLEIIQLNIAILAAIYWLCWLIEPSVLKKLRH